MVDDMISPLCCSFFDRSNKDCSSSYFQISMAQSDQAPRAKRASLSFVFRSSGTKQKKVVKMKDNAVARPGGLSTAWFRLESKPVLALGSSADSWTAPPTLGGLTPSDPLQLHSDRETIGRAYCGVYKEKFKDGKRFLPSGWHTHMSGRSIALCRPSTKSLTGRTKKVFFKKGLA